jgi:D-amino-acid dehydrogenase
LALESTDIHRQLAAEGLNPTLRKTGAVDVYLRQPRSALSGLLSFERLKQLEPLIEDVVAGTHDTEEWTVESRSFVKAMLDDAVSHGADVLFGTPVERLVAEGGGVIGVDTPAGAIFADHVVLAAGLQSAALAAHVGLNLPLRGGRGHVVDVELPMHGIPTMPVRIKEHRVVVTPLEDRVRVCGSLEFGKESRRADPRRGQALLDIAMRVLPVLRDQPVIERWSGERPCTADGVPVIGPSRWVKNLWVATGHGMWGMILAPITGRHVAAAIVEGSPLFSDGLLNPDRFTRSNGASWANAS